MVQITRSAKLYQERRQPQTQPTMRSPGPQVYLPDNLVNKLKLEPPALQAGCDPGPDQPTTKVWPYGDQYAQ
jgi:hypothetical protein